MAALFICFFLVARVSYPFYHCRLRLQDCGFPSLCVPCLEDSNSNWSVKPQETTLLSTIYKRTTESTGTLLNVFHSVQTTTNDLL